jgi:alpha-acetolactate decarboxylase
VGHEDDSLSALFNGILDGRQSTDDTLGVGDCGVVLLVEGDIEVNLAAQTLEKVT